ncbi:MAG: type IV pilus secretin PilQ family protein [Lysobacter sp.]|uniref:Type IV pilus biogenesis and competence protein PilQ n=1 Tax=Novilysobacter luteus TaxID=2822368 RepID=A0ABM8UD69_9GAMM|nr:type IV pilus secretin PilQ family protein [Lysobacter sp.]CAG4969870.1 Type IV pilus biogenesis and competence protein PilQ [Lysobacter luteus]
MTVFKATRALPARRPLSRALARTAGCGLLLGAVAAFSGVQAASPDAAGGTFTPTFITQMAPATSPDPAKQLPGTISVSDIDFKRGDGGAGRLILRFTGEGAAPDLQTQGSRVVIDVANASIPASLQKPINVSDFATPVEQIDARSAGGGTTLVLNTEGAFESMAYQTGNEYIVEIVPRAPAAVARTDNGGNAAMGQTISTTSDSRSYAGRPVTFNFQDVPVRTVLQLIAEESGLNIVASDTVTGNVTLRLVNVPWDQALDIVLQAKGLDKRRSGNVVWIAPQSEIAQYEQDKEDARIALSNRVELVTEYIQINYHNAAQIYKALTEAKGVGGSGGGGGQGGQGSNVDTGFLSPRGRLVADERTNTLMISDTPKKVAEMKELIRVIDRPVDQVVIEARVVVATESFMRELGARFGLTGTKDNVAFSGNLDVNDDNLNSTSTITRGLMTDLAVTNPAGAVALSILNAGYLLDVELSAMQTQGRGEVISNPRIVTSNQREAVIRQGQEVGYVTIQPAQAGGVATPSVQFKEVLLEMRVTPTITNDGRVFLNLNVKKDEIEGFVDTSIGDVPQISTRSVNTAVLVEDGQTVVVGGVYEFRERDDVSKVPFLGDIPFLGNLFKKKGRSKEKAELLIFVTPKVLEVAQRNHR